MSDKQALSPRETHFAIFIFHFSFFISWNCGYQFEDQ